MYICWPCGISAMPRERGGREGLKGGTEQREEGHIISKWA